MVTKPIIHKPLTTKEFLVDILQEDGVRPEAIKKVLAHPVKVFKLFKELIEEFVEISDYIENKRITKNAALEILAEAFCNWYSHGLQEDYAATLNKMVQKGV